MAMGEKVDFLGIEVDNVMPDEIVSHVSACIQRQVPCHIVGLNINQAVQVLEDSYSKEIFDAAELVFTDGVPIVWLSKGLKRPIKNRVSGPDLMVMLCKEAAKMGYSIFLFGANEGVAHRAGENLQTMFPGLRVAGSYSPPYNFEKDKAEMGRIIAILKESGADMLFVGLGSPKQDVFIYENMNTYGIPVSFSMGAALDFLSGNKQRVPMWISNIGFEWLYRLCQEPRRLFNRYSHDGRRILSHYRRFKKAEKVAGRL